MNELGTRIKNFASQELLASVGAENGEEYKRTPAYQQAYLDRVIDLQNQAYLQISQGIRRHETFDHGAIRFISEQLGEPEEKLRGIIADNLASYHDFIRQAGGRYSLLDINSLENKGIDKIYYHQELGLRQNTAAASDIVRLKVLDQHGGVYFDVDFLPELKKISSPAPHSSRNNPDINDFIRTELILDHLRETSGNRLTLAESGRRHDGIDQSMQDNRADNASSENRARLRLEIRSQGNSPGDFFQPLGQQRLHSDGILLANLMSRISNAGIVAHSGSVALAAAMERITQNYQMLENANLVAINQADDIMQRGGAFIAQLHQMSKKEKLELVPINFQAMHYRKDGIKPGSRATIAISGPTAVRQGVESLAKRLFALQNSLIIAGNHHAIVGWFQQFNFATREERQHSWEAEKLTTDSSVPLTPLSLEEWDPVNRKNHTTAPEAIIHYDYQIIVQLENDPAVRHSVEKLAARHPSGTLIVQHDIRNGLSRLFHYDAGSQSWNQMAEGAAMPVGKSVKWYFAGHGREQYNGINTTLGGYSASQLYRGMKALSQEKSLPLPQRVVLLGCQLAPDGTTALVDHFALNFMRAISVDRPDVSLRAYNTAISLSDSGHRVTYGSDGQQSGEGQQSGKKILHHRVGYSLDADGQIVINGNTGRLPGINRILGRIAHANQGHGYLKTAITLSHYWRRTNGDRLNAQQQQELEVETSIALAGIVWDLGSHAAEYGLVKLGHHLAHQQPLYTASGIQFATSHSAPAAGLKLARYGGPALSILSSGFDIYSAHRDFLRLGNATSQRSRIDLIVSGAISSSAAAVSIATALAIAAGGGLLLPSVRHSVLQQVLHSLWEEIFMPLRVRLKTSNSMCH